jgi:hypothetical protein
LVPASAAIERPEHRRTRIQSLNHQHHLATGRWTDERCDDLVHMIVQPDVALERESGSDRPGAGDLTRLRGR